jgi:hypothetical protein
VRLRRRDLLAYLVGAGIAGTLLIAPYALRVATETLLPGAVVPLAPVVLLPILWGAWNVLWVRRRPPVSVATWGALLGLVAASVANAFFWAADAWFPAVALLLVFLPVVYWLAWRLVVGPINEALGVERS